MVIDEDRSGSLVSIFQQDYDDVSDSPSSYVRDLVARTFCPMPALQT
jgi:hypothetical protein